MNMALKPVTTHPSPLAPLVDFLQRHAPFNRMATTDLEFLSKRLKLGFYAKGEAVTSPTDGPSNRFYIIKQGRIRGELGKEGPDEEGAWELVTGECFPIGALLSRRPVRTVNRAVEDSFCYELDRGDFDKLFEISPVFQDFCTRRLASLLDSALRGVQASSATRVSEDSPLNAPLRSLLARPPITCAPDTPLGEALAVMDREHIGSLVVVDGEQRPLGVFTLHDVLSRVALPRAGHDMPMAELMTPDPHSVPPEARAYEAALLMAQHGFSHICVVEGGRLVGVVSERDLFSLQRIGLVSLSRSISRAEDIATLKVLGQRTHRLVDQMLAQGASVEQLGQIITTLNDSIAQRVISLVMSDLGKPPVNFTWLAFGSEGRGEQTLKTDQDNGILFFAPPGKTANETRQALLPFARRVNAELAEVGFPLCPGNIMAGNPDCCLSLDEWRDRFDRWIDQGTPEHLLNASIYFDFRPLYGEPGSCAELRHWVLARIAANPRFLRQMTENALRNRPPLGWMGDIVVGDEGLDLKVHGTTPFVDAARLIALSGRIGETNTVARLKAAAASGVVREPEAEAWCHAYQFLTLLRMRNHQQQAHEGLPLSNFIDPDRLDELDRRILKEAFRQARKLQSFIALEYQL